MLKVSDLGLSRFKPATSTALMTGQCGTWQWMAPEVMMGRHYTEKVDVYSFGINLFEMLSRRTPFDGLQGVQVRSPDRPVPAHGGCRSDRGAPPQLDSCRLRWQL